MFMPGLEARLGFANDNGSSHDDDVQQLNGWLGWNPGDLTLAVEFDSFSLANDKDAWNMMLLANYQFSDFFGATIDIHTWILKLTSQIGLPCSLCLQ
jgi:hypothetical protein